MFSESPQEIPYLQAAKVLREVSDAPAADVAPVVHGQWIEDHDYLKCPECGVMVKWDFTFSILEIGITAPTAEPRWTEVLKMQAKKCDRCGRLYEHYDGRKAFPKSLSNSIGLRDTDNNGNYLSRDHLDLCVSCMVGLEVFLYGGTENAVD